MARAEDTTVLTLDWKHPTGGDGEWSKLDCGCKVSAGIQDGQIGVVRCYQHQPYGPPIDKIEQHLGVELELLEI